MRLEDLARPRVRAAIDRIADALTETAAGEFDVERREDAVVVRGGPRLWRDVRLRWVGLLGRR